MKTRLGIPGLAVFVAACVAFPAAALARSKGEVLDSIKARYPALLKLLADKRVGETAQGLIEAVKSASLQDKVEAKGQTITLAQFIQDENNDRTEYFGIAARETKTTPEIVARNFGRVRESKLNKGEFWKGDDGKWEQKK
ncbi:MAG TPA: DUF1318 domain-containing protein [Planctomycetota bacterium]|nr:DUF1318 domain-containing protein [Planctomycetota bacterium]HRR79190.1 DUF1318 domain-containing protein [Planctomycetota bacterium]HRT97042.1 DUF1318 domain-containing protein [Planctomycetota bacterium]